MLRETTKEEFETFYTKGYYSQSAEKTMDFWTDCNYYRDCNISKSLFYIFNIKTKEKNDPQFNMDQNSSKLRTARLLFWLSVVTAWKDGLELAITFLAEKEQTEL